MSVIHQVLQDLEQRKQREQSGFDIITTQRQEPNGHTILIWILSGVLLLLTVAVFVILSNLDSLYQAFHEEPTDTKPPSSTTPLQPPQQPSTQKSIPPVAIVTNPAPETTAQQPVTANTQPTSAPTPVAREVTQTQPVQEPTSTTTIVAERSPPFIHQILPNPVIGSRTKQRVTIVGEHFDKQDQIFVCWPGKCKILANHQAEFVNSNTLNMYITTGVNREKWSVQIQQDEQRSNTLLFSIEPPTENQASVDTATTTAVLSLPPLEANPTQNAAPAATKPTVSATATPIAKVADQNSNPMQETAERLTKQQLPSTNLEQADHLAQKAQQSLQAGNTIIAEAEWLQALHIYPTHRPSRESLYALYQQTKRPHQAKSVVQQGLELDPGYPFYRLTLAKLELEQDRIAEAIELISQGLQLDTTNSELHAFLATLYQRDQQISASIQHFETALRYDSTKPHWWIGLGMSQTMANNGAAAIHAYKQAQQYVDQLPPKLQQFVSEKLTQLQQLTAKAAE